MTLKAGKAFFFFFFSKAQDEQEQTIPKCLSLSLSLASLALFYISRLVQLHELFSPFFFMFLKLFLYIYFNTNCYTFLSVLFAII